ncbi:UNVERIFIED_CONTAM: hypothetical protein FKN15_071333 [Acipenser sinensis]
MDDIGDHHIVVLSVLKGGHRFCVDRVKYIKVLSRNSNRSIPMRVDFIRLKSYCEQSRASDAPCENPQRATATLHSQDVKLRSPNCMTRLAHHAVMPLPDVGFEILNCYVVGYALDNNEYFRDLNCTTRYRVLKWNYIGYNIDFFHNCTFETCFANGSAKQVRCME